jgi:hypothetical protein
VWGRDFRIAHVVVGYRIQNEAALSPTPNRPRTGRIPAIQSGLVWQCNAALQLNRRGGVRPSAT